MGIYAFATSVAFLIFVAKIKRIRILSTYGIFILFQILYNVTPWVMLKYGPPQTLFMLLTDGALINLQLWLTSSANVCLGLFFLFLYKRVPFHTINTKVQAKRKRNYFLIAIPIFLVTCVLCEKYGWHAYTFAEHMSEGQPPGGLYTFTAYVKYFFVAVYLYYIAKYGLDKWSWLLLAEHVIVMVVDGGRTTFLPIMLITLIMFIEQNKDRRLVRRVYIAAIVGIVVSIGTRALILVGDSIGQKMLIPVAIEGTMGDYPALQSLQGTNNIFHPTYTFGKSYIFDPLVWLLPQAMRGDTSSFDGWTEQISYTLPDRFAPMGGFYYISESIAAFSYAGPAIVTSLFALALIWFERHKNSHRMLYISWVSTIGFLFIKMIFANCFKLFLINLIFIGLIEATSRMRLLMTRAQASQRLLSSQ